METKVHEVKKEPIVRPVYVRFGRGENVEAITLQPEVIVLVKKALLNLTNEGDMATGGGTTGRTPKGREQSETIFKLVELLEDKAD